jgi:hypothetical protein
LAPLARHGMALHDNPINQSQVLHIADCANPWGVDDELVWTVDTTQLKLECKRCKPKDADEILRKNLRMRFDESELAHAACRPQGGLILVAAKPEATTTIKKFTTTIIEGLTRPRARKVRLRIGNTHFVHKDVLRKALTELGSVWYLEMARPRAQAKPGAQAKPDARANPSPSFGAAAIAIMSITHGKTIPGCITMQHRDVGRITMPITMLGLKPQDGKGHDMSKHEGRQGARMEPREQAARTQDKGTTKRQDAADRLEDLIRLQRRVRGWLLRKRPKSTQKNQPTCPDAAACLKIANLIGDFACSCAEAESGQPGAVQVQEHDPACALLPQAVCAATPTFLEALSASEANKSGAPSARDFFSAIESSDVNAVKQALLADPTLATKDYNSTRLFPIHACNDARVAGLLLDAKANPNAVDKEGETALFKIKKSELVAVLVAAGANVAHVSNDGSTALDHAQENAEQELLQALNEYKPTQRPAARAGRLSGWEAFRSHSAEGVDATTIAGEEACAQFFVTGSCPRGHQCPRAHSRTALPPAEQLWRQMIKVQAARPHGSADSKAGSSSPDHKRLRRGGGRPPIAVLRSNDPRTTTDEKTSPGRKRKRRPKKAAVPVAPQPRQ